MHGGLCTFKLILVGVKDLVVKQKELPEYNLSYRKLLTRSNEPTLKKKGMATKLEGQPAP